MNWDWWDTLYIWDRENLTKVNTKQCQHFCAVPLLYNLYCSLRVVLCESRSCTTISRLLCIIFILNTAVSQFLVTIDICTLHSITWVKYWNDRLTRRSKHVLILCELSFQYFAHVTNCNVQMSIETRNCETIVPLVCLSQVVLSPYSTMFCVVVPQEYPSFAMIKSILLEKGISPIFLVTKSNLYNVRVHSSFAACPYMMWEFAVAFTLHSNLL